MDKAEREIKKKQIEKKQCSGNNNKYKEIIKEKI